MGNFKFILIVTGDRLPLNLIFSKEKEQNLKEIYNQDTVFQKVAAVLDYVILSTVT